MNAGLAHRLGRIFGRDGKAMILPVDHGIMLGRVAGLERPRELVEAAVAAGVDGLLMSPGVARNTADIFADRHAPTRLLTVDTSFSDGDEGAAALVSSVRDAAVLGLDAVKLLMAWDVPSAARTATSRRIATVVEEAGRWQVPVMVEPIALNTPRSEQTVELETHAARIAMELGADIIKIAYPGSPGAMRALVEELGLPVVILGGPRTTTADDLLGLVEEAMGAGASGIVIGRQVWQREPAERAAVMRALVDVVHGRVSAEAALARA